MLGPFLRKHHTSLHIFPESLGAQSAVLTTLRKPHTAITHRLQTVTGLRATQMFDVSAGRTNASTTTSSTFQFSLPGAPQTMKNKGFHIQKPCLLLGKARFFVVCWDPGSLVLFQAMVDKPLGTGSAPGRLPGSPRPSHFPFPWSIRVWRSTSSGVHCPGDPATAGGPETLHGGMVPHEA